MADVRTWFCRELRRLGFEGFESMYDYVLSLRDEEATAYILSLLGSQQPTQAFAVSFLRKRAASATACGAPEDNTLSFWEDVSSPSAAHSKKFKRGRGKAQASGKSSRTSRSQNVRNTQSSFANKVAPVPKQESEQSIAIRNSPVEQARRKIDEYRRAKRAVNCIRCGKIERLVREDGACSFCKADIFSVWEGDEQDSSTKGLAGPSSRTKRASTSVTRRPYPVVLGRYCIPSEMMSGGKSKGSPLIQPSAERDSERQPDEEGNAWTEEACGYYETKTVNRRDLEKCCNAHAHTLKELVTSERAQDSPSVQSQGPLRIDDLSPSVAMC